MPLDKALLTSWNKKFSKAANVPLSVEFLDKNHRVIDITAYYNRNYGFIPFGETLTISIKSPITNSVVYQATIGSQPGLCGCMYFTSLHKSYSPYLVRENKKPMATLLITFITDIAKQLRYRSVTCSNIVPNEDINVPNPTPDDSKGKIPNWAYHKFKQNLISCGYTVTQDFINERTKNRINIYHIKL